MSLFITFLTVAAWVGLVVGGAWLALAVWATMDYEGSRMQKLHALEGRRQYWPMKVPALITVFSVIFLIAKAISG